MSSHRLFVAARAAAVSAAKALAPPASSTGAENSAVEAKDSSPAAARQALAVTGSPYAGGPGAPAIAPRADASVSKHALKSSRACSRRPLSSQAPFRPSPKTRSTPSPSMICAVDGCH